MAQAPPANVFAAKKVKLDLPAMFSGNVEKLEDWMFAIEQYCQIIGIMETLYKVKLGISRLEKDALTLWQGFLVQHPNSLIDGHYDMLDWVLF